MGGVLSLLRVRLLRWDPVGCAKPFEAAVRLYLVSYYGVLSVVEDVEESAVS